MEKYLLALALPLALASCAGGPGTYVVALPVEG
jgi:hypothetical protein